MFKLCVVAVVLAVAAMASVDGAVAVYRHSFPPFPFPPNPYYGFGGIDGFGVPAVGSQVESKKAEGNAFPVISYQAPYYYGYPYYGYPYGYPAVRLARDADKNIEQIEPATEKSV